MRLVLSCIAASFALSGAAFAQDAAPAEAPAAVAAPALKAGALLTTADGRRLGRIDRVYTDANGQAVSASVIADSRFVYIPASTISANEKGFVTSLSRAEVRKLK